jgi:hypothetical protein
MGTPFEEEERTNTKAEPSASPEPVALGADAAPTTVALGAEPSAPTAVLLGTEDAAATSMVPWPANDVPMPKEFESTTVVPWPETADRGPPVHLNSGPTEPGVNVPPPFPREPPSNSRTLKKPNSPLMTSPPVVSSPPVPTDPQLMSSPPMMFNQTLPNGAPLGSKPPIVPTGFTALGTDIDPQETKVQAQVSPLLISRPKKASMRGRLANRLSMELRIPVGDGKARLRVYGIICLTALLALGLMIGTFNLVSWALTSRIESGKKAVVVQPAPKKRK